MSDGIERKEEQLYSRTGKQEESKRPALRPRFVDAPRQWQQDTQAAPEEPTDDHFMKPLARKSAFSAKNAFIASIGFFVIALGIAAWFVFGGSNVISTKNVDIQVSAPLDVAAGDVLPIQLTITNKNPTQIELADLIVEFPDGTRSDTDLSVALPRIRETLGTIQPGESVNRTVRAVLFGEQGSAQHIKISVEYHVPSSNAVFGSDTAYTPTISSSPMSVIVEGPSTAVSGQQESYTLTVRSNAKSPLHNVLVTAEYPFGWSVASAQPSAVGNGRTWSLGDIPAGESRSVVLTGSFTGQDGEERVLRFAAGSAEASGDTSLKVPYVTKDVSVTLSRPFVSADLVINSESSGDIIASRGQNVSGQVQWKNNLPVTVHSVQIEVKLAGNALDPTTVKTDSGFYRSSDSTIVWSSETNNVLADVAPGQAGTFSFSFSPYALSRGGTYHSATIQLMAAVVGKQDGSSIPDTVDNAAQRRVLIATDLAVVASATHASGPVPPKANQQTTYTVTWMATNSANAVANAAVSAVLPSYVTWSGGASAGESVSFDPNNRTVTWQLGNLAASTASPVRRQASFQITLTPSVSQAGQSPSIIGDAKLSGADRFTGSIVTATAGALTTKTSDAASGQENVVP